MSQGVLLLFLIGILVSFLTAIAQKALTEIAWHDLEEYCRRRQRESIFDEIHDRWETAVASTEALQTMAIVGAIVSVAVYQAGQLALVNASIDGRQVTSWAVMLALLALGCIVWVPREVARCWGSAYLMFTWPVWRWIDRTMWPMHALTRLIRLVTRRLDGNSRESTEEEALEDEILSIVTEGQHDGLLEDDVREMIAGVIELDDTDVADIMTPKSNMDMIPLDMPWGDILQFVVRVGRTRIPVYDKNRDDVVGLLYVKDLLTFLSDKRPEQPQLSTILRPVQSVPAKTRLDEMLQNFLNTRSHLAMVVDEYMHVVGLVTIEDVLEEIVGEIVDETDPEEPNEIRWIDERSAEIMGRAHVEEINETLGTMLPTSQEYDTIGGFILHQFGRIPSKGESLRWENLVITIDQATKRRIERLVISL